MATYRRDITDLYLSSEALKDIQNWTNTDIKGWPVTWPKYYNGTNVPCNFLVGPCDCGAWHDKDEFALDTFGNVTRNRIAGYFVSEDELQIRKFIEDTDREFYV